MSVAYFLQLDSLASGLTEHQIQRFRRHLDRLPHKQRYTLLTPESSQDPFLNDGIGPAFVIQACFTDKFSLEQTLVSAEFQHLLEAIDTVRVQGGELWQEAMVLENYPVPGQTGEPGVISYRVCYRRPAADETAFLAHYRAHHPSIMVRFTGLRHLQLGLPLDWRPVDGIRQADYLLFCDVSFDNVVSLNTALASAVRQELRRDFKTFPAFSGSVSHYAMRRRI